MFSPALIKNYFCLQEAKKWQERKEALDALLKLTENPKLENGDYGPLVKSVSKVSNDQRSGKIFLCSLSLIQSVFS